MTTNPNNQSPLSHFDHAGNAIMVDVSTKTATTREAVATGRVVMSPTVYAMVRNKEMAKGDVLGVARLAGIMAAKKVDQLIPLAHPLNITKAEVNFNFDDASSSIDISAIVKITGQTGVEMEALTAVTISALTIYDMCKAADKGMIITDIKLVKKTGGKSGTFLAAT